MSATTKGSLFSPAAERNSEPILAALRSILPRTGRVLEIASGTGQHVVHFAAAFPELSFQPTDRDPEALASIDARREACALANVSPAVELDVEKPWVLSAPSFDAVLCINMIHIAPWSATRALFEGSHGILGDAGLLVLYGPFRFHGAFLAPSNAEFSRSLAERDPRWGVRDIDDVAAEATRAGFAMSAPIAMPANNHLIAFEKRPRS